MTAHDALAGHAVGLTAIGEARTDVRALAVEVRQVAATVAGMEARLTVRLDRMEERMDAAVAREPRRER